MVSSRDRIVSTPAEKPTSVPQAGGAASIGSPLLAEKTGLMKWWMDTARSMVPSAQAQKS